MRCGPGPGSADRGMAAQVDLGPVVIGNVRVGQLDAVELGRVRRAHAREHLDVAGAFAA